jgi:16S rRNA (uracil1498-N3)-methyltransferase
VSARPRRSRPASGPESGPACRGASPPAFFLAPDSRAERPSLAAEDETHAARVLRLAAGDTLVGLDGRGGRQALRVTAVRKGHLELEAVGAPARDPAPGEEGSPLPWFELAVAWPRRNRVEDMLGRLVQLGAAAIRPLAARQRGPEEPPDGIPARLVRVLREACKQSGRSWVPELEPTLTPEELARARPTAVVAVLDPYQGLPFDIWLRSLQPSPAGIGTRTRPIVLVVGPEGGLTAEELEAFRQHGASSAWLAPHVLRVETAAEAAMAVAAVVHGRPVRRDDPAAPA